LIVAVPDRLQEIIEDDPHGVIIPLFVQPRSSRNALAGIHGGALKLAVTAPPVDGRANKAVTVFLAKFFGIAKSAVVVKSGLQSRQKRCLLKGISRDQIRRKIEEDLQRRE